MRVHKSFEERGLGRREIGKQVGGSADARVCPEVPMYLCASGGCVGWDLRTNSTHSGPVVRRNLRARWNFSFKICMVLYSPGQQSELPGEPSCKSLADNIWNIISMLGMEGRGRERESRSRCVRVSACMHVCVHSMCLSGTQRLKVSE